MLLWGVAGVSGLVLLGAIIGPGGKPDDQSAGYLRPGECMSAENYNRRAADVVSRTDWSAVPGSAMYSLSTKLLLGGVTVFREMLRLGTTACADLEPIYAQYRLASSPRQAAGGSVPEPGAVRSSLGPRTAIQHGILTTDANIRSGPSTSFAIVRVAKKGDAVTIFDTRDGWAEVGAPDRVEGWVANSLLKRQQ